jgi:hypothetical protein
MRNLLLRFRGLAIAIAVLAISAGAVFATAPRFAPVSSPAAEEPTASPAPTAAAGDEDEDQDEDQDEDEDGTPEATEAPEGTEAPDASGSPEADNHGALVSAAAQMETPEGFANHGAFVSCVAHMDGTPSTVDLATVTAETCMAADEARAAAKAKAEAAKAAGKAKAEAGRAKGKLNRGSHGPRN